MTDAAERIAGFAKAHLLKHLDPQVAGPIAKSIEDYIRDEQDAEGVAREIVRRLHAAGGLRLATPIDLCGRVNAMAEMEEIAADLIRQGRSDG